MQAQLVVIAGPDQGRGFTLAEGQTVVVGRGEKTDTKLKDPQVSRVHCQVQMQGNRALLVDSGSTGGTLIGGKRIKEHELKPGEVIQVGGTQLQFRVEPSPEASTVVISSPAPPRPVSEKAAGQLSELVGQTLGHFRIDATIARGQSGMVFKAHDTRADRPVALKVLWPEFSQREEEMQRFVRAMKTALPLRHPNLVGVYGAGKTGNYCWIAMEYVDGESLTQVIQRIGTAGMLDWRNALRVAIHVGRALDFAEGHQIIHRNIKPSNILIQHSDKLTKLGDLMLAKAMEGTLAEQITRPGELVGDIAYMSPERTRSSSGQVDSRSDIYSLGATVYALLTGRPPFDAGSLPETIMKIRTAEPVKPKKFQLAIPDLFEGTVLKMLAKRPDERFQTASALVAELERVAKFQGMSI
jgi:serine/threonine protein kinase